MEFFNSAIEVLQTLVVALGAGLGVWGAINLAPEHICSCRGRGERRDFYMSDISYNGYDK